MSNLQVVEHQDQRVLTTQQLAEAYGTDSRRISENFNRNKERFVPSKHFVALQGEEKKDFLSHTQIADTSKFAPVLYLWTEKGAWLHAKSLNTDEAWNAYEHLVDDYYIVKKQVRVLSEREQLMASMKLTLETAEEITTIKSEVKEIRSMVAEQITIDYGEQRKLQKTIAKAVYKLADVRDEKDRLFREIHRELKDRFGVASYKDIKRKDLNTALNYIEAWIPRKVS